MYVFNMHNQNMLRERENARGRERGRAQRAASGDSPRGAGPNSPCPLLVPRSLFCAVSAARAAPRRRGDRYLNACAVLSQLGRHASGLEHAQQALILLQEELSRVVGPMATEDTPPRADRIAVLAIAYHNVGVEQVTPSVTSATSVVHARAIHATACHNIGVVQAWRAWRAWRAARVARVARVARAEEKEKGVRAGGETSARRPDVVRCLAAAAGRATRQRRATSHT